MSAKLPLEIVDDRNDKASFLNKKYVHVGPKKYFLPDSYKKYCDTFYNLEPRSDDVWLFGLPRSGTTLTQEIIWLIANDLDFEIAEKSSIISRFPYLEYGLFFEKQIDCISSLYKTTNRRFIKSHLPLSFFPQNLWSSGCKIIYCVRDPRDVIVSRYHLYKLIYKENFNIDFKTYWNFYKNNELPYLPHIEHIKEGWNKRNEENVLFLRYEETNKNKRETIKKIAKYFNKQLSEEQIDQLERHTEIDKFRKNKSVNHEHLIDFGVNKQEEKFIRKGKVGSWREYFTGELENEVNEWLQENLKDTDITFM